MLNMPFISTAEENLNKYTLTVTDANHHLAEVEVEFNNIQSKTFNIKLPVWRSGNYQILDLSKNIRHFEVVDANNKPLTWDKNNKNTWRVFINTPGIIKVRYQIYANQLRRRVSHIDETHAFLDASGVFVYSESQRDKGLTIKLNVPEKWHSVSGMESIGEHQFKANNYDQLIDSPIESGLHYFDSIQVEEQLYEIVIWGKSNFDIERIKEDISKLHYQAKNMWKTFPFSRYVYMFHAGDKLRGATEHINSTIIQLDRFGFAPDEKYRKIISTTSHEFIHTWNVKSYRPAGISPYDYNKENYSDLFWMAEGTTSFYDKLFLARSGIISLDEYLESLAKDINTFKNKPGRGVMSLAESSFDTWMDNDATRRHNTTVSIYLKGSLVSWLLDKEIRDVTNNKKSLDDLQYMLFEKYANDTMGYSSSNVKQLLKILTGQDFTQFWESYVEGIKEIDFEQLLGFYGLQFDNDDKDKKASFNAKFQDDKGMAKISTLDSNGAAWVAGIATDDVLIALDGFKLTYSNIKKRIEELKVGQSYKLHYFSQGILKETTVVPMNAPPDKLKIIAINKATKAQKKQFASWSKQKFKELSKDKSKK